GAEPLTLVGRMVNMANPSQSALDSPGLRTDYASVLLKKLPRCFDFAQARRRFLLAPRLPVRSSRSSAVREGWSDRHVLSPRTTSGRGQSFVPVWRIVDTRVVGSRPPTSRQ